MAVLNIAAAKDTSENNTKTANTATITMIIIIVIGAILAVILGLLLSFSISTPINFITEGAKKLAVGDIALKGLSQDTLTKINKRNDELGSIGKAFSNLIAYFQDKVNAADEIAKGNLRIDIVPASADDKLGVAFKQTVESLNDLLGQVNVAVDQTATGSTQVSEASQTLSQGATEQASSLEEITSSITEVNSQSKQNAESANKANEMAKQAMTGAEAGNKQMKDLVVAMVDINKSADGIKLIAKSIDDIAFQINLLALNANVEAARAGKYGKGFAVVAEEVRNLAARSGQSVKEATTMVDDAIKNITNGSKLVEVTAKQIEDILNIASKVADIAEEVTHASKEQTQGLDQITQGLGQIDQVTQSNTANAEESASAAEELASQAQQLKAIIEKFQLKNIDNIKSQQKQVGHEFKHFDTKKAGAERTDRANKIKQVPKNTTGQTIRLDDDDFGKY
jgi:methyl-accepting chemotaxis protein